MDIITFQCDKCDKVMRIGADKAGKKAKCNRCGANLVIPNQSQAISENPAPKAKVSFFGDEDSGGVYSFLEDAETAESLEEQKKKSKQDRKVDIKDLYKSDDEDEDEDEEEIDEEEERKKEMEEERLRDINRSRREALQAARKTPMDIVAWEKVRLGFILIAIGVGFWMASVFLQKLVFLFGLGYTNDYANVATNQLLDKKEMLDPEIGMVPTLHRTRFIVGLVGGSEMIEMNLWLYRISYLFTLIQLVCTGTGYVFCISAPSRFGAKGLAIALLPVVVISFILTLFLKLLPMSGAYTYTMIQLLAPEVGIMRANIERVIPIHVFWAAAPFWESLLAILLHLTTFGELVLFCIFMHSVAKIIKDEKLEKETNPLTRLGLSVGFILMGFLLLINTGTTEVLINVLWIVYIFTSCFYFWFLIWFMIVLFKTRERIRKALLVFGGEVEQEGGDEDEDYEEVEDEEEEEEDEDY